jgi:hypothetical protein
MMNLARNLRIARALNAVAAGQSNQNGGVIDMANYEGVVFIAALGTLASGAVTGMKAQQGNQANLSDAADLAGTAVSIADAEDNELLVLDIYRPAERYVRAVVTRGTADATIDGVIAIQYGPRVLPVTQDATVAAIQTHVSPAEGTA